MYFSAKENPGSDIERDVNRIACLPPAKLILPVASPVIQIACGLHHSLLLLQNGQVLPIYKYIKVVPSLP